MAAALPPVFTVHDTMVASGINDTDNFDGRCSADPIAEDMFEDDFSICMDKTHKDIVNDFMTFSIITTAQGKILLFLGVKKRIKVFI